MRSVILDRAFEEGFHALIDLLAQPADLACRNALMEARSCQSPLPIAFANRLVEIIEGALQEAPNTGLPDPAVSVFSASNARV